MNTEQTSKNIFMYKKQINLYYFTYFYMILYDFINCPAFLDIKQTFRYELEI